MTIDLAAIGRRLAEARKNRGSTQEQAAEALGLPRTAIVQMEAGNRSISTLELSQLAELYEHPIADFFSAAPAKEADPLIALGRIAPEISDDPEANAAVRHYLKICQEGMRLRELLGGSPFSGPPAYSHPAPSNYAQAVEQGHAAAAEERKRLELDDAPIADVSDLVASQGIWATGAHLPEGISGLFFHMPSTGMAILVNYGHVKSRKRFLYAHEYAHALFDRHLTVTLTTRSNSKDLIERRANAFAAAFLMPAGGVHAFLQALDKGGPSRRVYHTYDVATSEGAESQRRASPGSQEIGPKETSQLAHHFGTSYQATCYRLTELGYANRQQLEELLGHESLGRMYLDMLGLAGLDKVDLKEHEKELVRQVLPLAVEAYRREEVSQGYLRDLSKLLGVSAQKLIEVASEA